MSDLGRLHGVVCGRVQGVAFRYFTQQTARVNGVSGWVRNLPNGDVEFEAQGTEEAMKEFVRFVRQGPALARVVDARIVQMEPVAGEQGFVIRY